MRANQDCKMNRNGCNASYKVSDKGTYKPIKIGFSCFDKTIIL